jgi:hypothetical protein
MEAPPSSLYQSVEREILIQCIRDLLGPRHIPSASQCECHLDIDDPSWCQIESSYGISASYIWIAELRLAYGGGGLP